MDAPSEREKMLSGALYRADDPELAAMRLRARRLLDRFNGAAAEDDSLRKEILRDLLGSLGEGRSSSRPSAATMGVTSRSGRAAS